MESNDLKEKPKFVIFELIQEYFGLKDPIILKHYLTEIFKDLVNVVDQQNKKFMTKMAFYDYIKLPIYITQKIFDSFSKLTSIGLCEEEFVENLCKLYKGSLEETLKVIFDILDFDNDGIIRKEEVKIFLYHLRMNGEDEEEKRIIKTKRENKSDVSSKIFERQIKNLKEIDDILDNSFEELENPNKMNFKQFVEITTEKNSEIFLRILCYLYEKMPFSARNLEAMKSKFNQGKEEKIQDINSENETKTEETGSISIKTSKRNSLILPTSFFFEKIKVRISLSDKDNENKIMPKEKTKISNNNGLLRKVSKSLSPENKNEKNKNLPNKNNNDKNIKNIKGKNNDNKQLKKGDTSSNQILKYKELKNENGKESVKNENGKEVTGNNIITNNDIIYENWVYKITDTGKLRKFYLLLVNKDIYYYKSETKTDFVCMHNLTGSFIQICNEKIRLQGKNYFSFEIYNKNKLKKRKFLTDDEFICKDFVYLIKRGIGYAKLPDLYQMKEIIGKGGFGEVYLGKNKKTREQVAIKILKKEKLI